MHTRFYLKLGSLKGGSTAAGHVQWIEVLSWSFGGHGTHLAPAKPALSELTFTRLPGALTTGLMKMVASAPTKGLAATLEVVSPEGKLVFRLEMRDVRVTAYRIGGGSAKNEPVSEKVTLAFRDYKSQYFGVKPAGTGTTWDL